MNRGQFRRDLDALGITLSEAQFEAFEGFETNLYDANKTRNFTRVPKEECASRHFIDSLLLASVIGRSGALLDIGTGPGFPAWPLACAFPELMVTALDSNGKMLGFLRDHPLPNLTVVQERAEEWGVVEAFDWVTGRALAPLAVQLEVSARPCKLGGTVVPLRTPGDRQEIDGLRDTLGLSLESVVEVTLPSTDIQRVIPIFRKVRRTPKGYPRPWAEVRRKPL